MESKKENICQYYIEVQPTPKSTPEQWCGCGDRESGDCCFPDYCKHYKELG